MWCHPARSEGPLHFADANRMHRSFASRRMTVSICARLPARVRTLLPGTDARLSLKSLRFQLQFIQLQELLHDGLVRLFHLFGGAEEDDSRFVQEHDAVGEFFGQAHIVGDDD